MATVELRFSALPEHVRTARLVAAAVARRAGVGESVLDEVRLAVGEACSRAVGLHRRSGVDAPVRVVLVEQEQRFLIEVGDGVGGDLPTPELTEDDSSADAMGLAVISGLVDDVDVSKDDHGGVIRMSWPVAPHPVLP